MSQRIHFSKMKSALVLGLGAASVATLAYYAYESSQQDYTQVSRSLSVTWPTHLALFNLDGHLTKPRSENRPIAVHLWASWCAPCVEEMPELIEMVKTQPQIDFYLISTDRQSEPLQKYLNSLDTRELQSIPNLFLFRDPMKQWMSHLNASGIPATYLFHSDKSFHTSWSGQKKWRVPETLSILNQLK